MNFEAMEAQNRIKNKRQEQVYGTIAKPISNSSYISHLFTRTLISVILVLSCAIFVNIRDENLLFFKNKLFTNTIPFAKINEIYKKYFGNLTPSIASNTAPVFQDTNLFTFISPWNDSYKAKMSSNAIPFLESGIVVFSGEKENFGQTVIVQGIDGVDIWYSNLSTSNLTMYDYVEKGNILGSANDNEVILTFIENGNYISYEKYIS